MIRLNNMSVLRYRDDEMQRLAAVHRDRVPEGCDWFYQYLSEAFPGTTFRIIRDWQVQETYVLLGDDSALFLGSEEVVTDEDGKPYVREYRLAQ